MSAHVMDDDDVEGKVFIGGLSWQTTEATLRSYFEKFGALSHVALMVDKRNGQPRGFAFVTMSDPATVDAICSQEHNIDGRKVEVKRAVPREKAPTPKIESKKIFVGGLHADVNDDEFREFFSKYGVVKDAVVMVDRTTNRSRGFGFITFEDEEAVEKTIKAENIIREKWVEVKKAEPKDLRYDHYNNNNNSQNTRGNGMRGGRGEGRGGRGQFANRSNNEIQGYHMGRGFDRNFAGFSAGYGPAPGFGMGFGAYPGFAYPPTGGFGGFAPPGNNTVRPSGDEGNVTGAGGNQFGYGNAPYGYFAGNGPNRAAAGGASAGNDGYNSYRGNAPQGAMPGRMTARTNNY